MQRLGDCCLDCGSAIASRIEDNHLPLFRMECITYICGATLRMSYSRNGATGRAIHTGCDLIEAQVAPL